MDIKIASRFEPLLSQAVASGRYASAEDVVHEGLRLVEARERARAELRQSITEALAEEGVVDEAGLDAAVAAKLQALKDRGLPE